MIRVRIADQRVVPWKNGRGTTTEVLVHPPGATVVAGFDWRISIAAIPEDGPFSSFPGVDRTLVLLDGAGVDLASPEGVERLVERYAVARFPGERQIVARLHDGPVRDLNVMVRRPLPHRVDVVRVDGALAVTGVAVVLDGALSVGGEPLAPTEGVRASTPCRLEGEGTVVVFEPPPG